MALTESRPPEAGLPERTGGEPVAWRDGKRYLWLLGLVVPLLPFGAWQLVDLTGQEWLWYFGPLFVFGFIPVADVLAGLDPTNPPPEAIERLENDRYYRWVTYAFLPLQYAGLVLAAYLWSSGGLDVADKVGLALTVGCVAGIGINTAHELGHKKEKNERWLARIALAQSFYGHFYIEHNRGHHVRVATPEDPASARLGETVYEFYPRTVWGSLVNAWGVEKRRLQRRGQSPWSPGNDVLSAWAMSVALWGALVAVFGIGVWPYLLLQAVIGVGLLETVNYLEHYGMRRQRVPSGRWERVNPSHSWNSNNLATNVLLYHLQRHSDHHANPTRRYQALRDCKQAPVLPTGYAGMIVLAMFPPLWRRVMDPRVLAHFDGDASQANLHTRRSARLQARYGVMPPPVPEVAR